MSGKIIAGGIVVIALVFGALVYYFQEYYYYQRVVPGPAEIALTPLGGGAPVPIEAGEVEAIDATSSPIRYRACFTTPLSLDALAAAYAPYPAAEPLTGPVWFSCFDAAAVGAALEQGAARAFLGQAGIHHGVDRVVAVFPDGRGYVWHQLDAEMRK